MIRLAVRCTPELAEAVLAELLELAPGGVEEAAGDGWVEYAIYGAPGELPSMPDVEAAAGDGLVEVTSREVADDWAERWREFHRPIFIGGRLYVRPPWEPESDGEGIVDIAIDPGRAFGTGAHPTTRLCLELLLELESGGRAEGPLADWGTGSAVLAIAAAKLGWSPVTGCDHDAAALEDAAVNAAANGVELSLSRADVRTGMIPIEGTVVANLTAPLLCSAASGLAARAEAPSVLLCSGLLEAEADRVAGEFERAGLVERSRQASGEWCALRLERR